MKFLDPLPIAEFDLDDVETLLECVEFTRAALLDLQQQLEHVDVDDEQLGDVIDDITRWASDLADRRDSVTGGDS